jgi:lipoprotein-anchoring transpeptidase ErfK/SrfK
MGSCQLTGADYNTHVDYAMPISWNGIMIHDASWRNKFGGNIYKYNGSHGCINTPLDKVKELFDLIEMDTPVIIY